MSSGLFSRAEGCWTFDARDQMPNRGRRLQPNADTAALIDKSALGRYPPNDIFSSQYPRHFAATLTRIFASNAICGVKLL
jgi:hypothetical protein